MKKVTYFSKDKAVVFRSSVQDVWSIEYWYNRNGKEWVSSALLHAVSTEFVINMIHQLRDNGSYTSKIGLDFDWRKEVA